MLPSYQHSINPKTPQTPPSPLSKHVDDPFKKSSKWSEAEQEVRYLKQMGFQVPSPSGDAASWQKMRRSPKSSTHKHQDGHAYPVPSSQTRRRPKYSVVKNTSKGKNSSSKRKPYKIRLVSPKNQNPNQMNFHSANDVSYQKASRLSNSSPKSADSAEQNVIKPLGPSLLKPNARSDSDTCGDRGIIRVDTLYDCEGALEKRVTTKKVSPKRSKSTLALLREEEGYMPRLQKDSVDTSGEDDEPNLPDIVSEAPSTHVSALSSKASERSPKGYNSPQSDLSSPSARKGMLQKANSMFSLPLHCSQKERREMIEYQRMSRKLLFHEYSNINSHPDKKSTKDKKKKNLSNFLS